MRLPSDVWAPVLPLKNFWDVISCLHSTHCQRISEEVLCIGWRRGGRSRGVEVCALTYSYAFIFVGTNITIYVHAVNAKILEYIICALVHSQMHTYTVPVYVPLCVYLCLYVNGHFIYNRVNCTSLHFVIWLLPLVDECHVTHLYLLAGNPCFPLIYASKAVYSYNMAIRC